MDWLAFMEKKGTELSNTGHIIDDEMFITHLLNSLPQVEYEGTIVVIKEQLRRVSVHVPEMEQILEDKYQPMKHVKGWDEEEDDYGLFMSHSNKKEQIKQYKGRCCYCGEFGHKDTDYPNKKSNLNKCYKGKTGKKGCKRLKRRTRERDKQICPQ